MSKNGSNNRSPISSLSNLLSPDAVELLEATGGNLVETIGMDVIRGVVLDVLTGRNIRSSTETLTRRRIASLNLALVDMFFKGKAEDPKFIENLPFIASEILSGSTTKAEEWLANWALGLTGKGVQNILRNDSSRIANYRDTYIKTCLDIIDHHEKTYGKIAGKMELENGPQIEITWIFLLYLLNTVGSETLTIRGSEKSLYGKFFEKLVLGALLSILGFEHVPSGDMKHPEKIFWLSSSSDRNRESDATILYEPGRGVRMDIGFIGSGNTEISLDKVSRYRREIELGSKNWFMGTIIIVDRIGSKSKIQKLADEIDGTIVQMSAGYWPKRIAITLNSLVGYEHPIIEMDQDDIEDYLVEKLRDVTLAEFIRTATGGSYDIESE